MSNLEAITLLDETTKRSSYPKIEVHAIAIFSILNNFMRRYSILLHEYIYIYTLMIGGMDGRIIYICIHLDGEMAGRID